MNDLKFESRTRSKSHTRALKVPIDPPSGPECRVHSDFLEVKNLST